MLATPVLLWSGWPFLVRAVESEKNHSLNLHSLPALRTGAAWLCRIVDSVPPGYRSTVRAPKKLAVPTRRG